MDPNERKRLIIESFLAGVVLAIAVLTLIWATVSAVAHAQETAQVAPGPADWVSAMLQGIGWPGALLGIAWKAFDFLGRWLDNTKGRIPIDIRVKNVYPSEDPTGPVNYRPMRKSANE